MPRVRVRKTERGLKPISAYEEAYTEITANNTSIRCTAEKFILHYVSLSRFVKKKKEAIEQGSAIPFLWAIVVTEHIPPALPSSSKALFSDADPGPSTSKAIFSPEVVRPFPKAPPRKTSSKRKSRKSAIYTDTPEKNAIQEKYDLKKKKQIKRKLTELKDEQKPVQKSKNTKS
ncbi:hypothetical protein JTB14_001807 [Gonioctena quinquepunctata]|nr:hypothetical protein JTB14_001807 [Gonioctena quinquepunctata]